MIIIISRLLQRMAIPPTHSRILILYRACIVSFTTCILSNQLPYDYYLLILS